jgi:hypothetical protein
LCHLAVGFCRPLCALEIAGINEKGLRGGLLAIDHYPGFSFINLSRRYLQIVDYYHYFSFQTEFSKILLPEERYFKTTK